MDHVAPAPTAPPTAGRRRRRAQALAGLLCIAASAGQAFAAPPADLPAPPGDAGPPPGAPSDPSGVPDPSVQPGPSAASPATPLVLSHTVTVSAKGVARVRLACKAAGVVHMAARIGHRTRAIHAGRFACRRGAATVRVAVPKVARAALRRAGALQVLVATRAAGVRRRGTVVLVAPRSGSRTVRTEQVAGYPGTIVCTSADAFGQPAEVDVWPAYLRTSSGVVGEYWWRNWLLTWSDTTQSWSWTPGSAGWHSQILTMYGAGDVSDGFYKSPGYGAYDIGYVQAWVKINGAWTDYSSYTSASPRSYGPATWGPYCYNP